MTGDDAGGAAGEALVAPTAAGRSVDGALAGVSAAEEGLGDAGTADVVPPVGLDGAAGPGDWARTPAGTARMASNNRTIRMNKADLCGDLGSARHGTRPARSNAAAVPTPL